MIVRWYHKTLMGIFGTWALLREMCYMWNPMLFHMLTSFLLESDFNGTLNGSVVFCALLGSPRLSQALYSLMWHTAQIIEGKNLKNMMMKVYCKHLFLKMSHVGSSSEITWRIWILIYRHWCPSLLLQWQLLNLSLHLKVNYYLDL